MEGEEWNGVKRSWWRINPCCSQLRRRRRLRLRLLHRGLSLHHKLLICRHRCCRLISRLIKRSPRLTSLARLEVADQTTNKSDNSSSNKSNNNNNERTNSKQSKSVKVEATGRSNQERKREKLVEGLTNRKRTSENQTELVGSSAPKSLSRQTTD